MSQLIKRLVDVLALRRQLADGADLIPTFKNALASAQQQLDQRFLVNDDIFMLVHARALVMDELLALSWHSFGFELETNIALLAVGGYGRAELHPYSDVDILILLKDTEALAQHKVQIEAFVTFLWDTSLDIGHSVRTLDECVEEAQKDITIATNLMESRVLSGSQALHQTLSQITGSDKLWPSSEFFAAKRQEQIDRHKKYNDTEYNLEPNVKSSPGGLRDIQMLGWVTKRHYNSSSLNELVSVGLLSDSDIETILDGQAFLWRVRYALHLEAGREENRLLFHLQPGIATQFGYQDNADSLAVEQFMKQYFRWALALTELNDVLLQYFDETIIRACEPENMQEINSRFRLCNGFIDVSNERVFSQHPSALLEIFVLIAQTPNLKGVRAKTIRLLREHRHLIDDNFRQDPVNKNTFMALLRSSDRVSSSLKRMKRYGILGKYIPAFGKIIGQTQHDMFHIYSVDAHTILVIMNMRRLFSDNADEEFPVVAEAARHIAQPELLYLAGLFHDIGKGRGGDHSKLGAKDAMDFCLAHNLEAKQAQLVEWLVKNHLLMSSVAQRQDISDPEVIRQFAIRVMDKTHLDYLYTLTVADINATNPNLWNSWRASLLRQLYKEARLALDKSPEYSANKTEIIANKKSQALSQLKRFGIIQQLTEAAWSNLGDDYFLRESSCDIAWHTLAVLEHENSQIPLVIIKDTPAKQMEGANQIFIYTANKSFLFALIASCLEQLDLNIVNARIIATEHGYTMDTFYVLDQDNQPINDDPKRLEQIRKTLENQLSAKDPVQDIVSRRTPRRLKHFSTPTKTIMNTDLENDLTVLEIISPDRPGLLARVAQVFMDFDIQLKNAKITTLGERVEDVFFITNNKNHAIADAKLCEQIQQAIKQILDSQIAESS